MRVQSLAAGLAVPARTVDLADDTASRKRTGLCNADELVTQDAAETHIALDQLQVGFTDACAQHSHQHFTRPAGVGDGRSSRTST
jgi:hypothetical protein